MVHMKDKKLIRHKKRWSQVRVMQLNTQVQMFCTQNFTNHLFLQIMYLYYIFGWRLNRQYFQKFKGGEELDGLKEKLKVRCLTLKFTTSISRE